MALGMMLDIGVSRWIQRVRQNCPCLSVRSVSSEWVSTAIMSDGKILRRNKVNYVRLLEMNTSKVGKIEIDLPLSEVCRYRTKLLLPMGRPIRFQKTKVMVPSTFTRSQPLRSSDIPQIYKLVANACLALPAASGSMRSLAN